MSADPKKKEIDDVTGIDTTGHEWDGIKELNYPLPRWWLNTFYGTVILSIAYVIAYPAIPGFASATPGLLGWSSRADVAKELTDAKAAQGELLGKLASADINAIAADPDLQKFAVAGGAAAFKVNCVQCHGSGAAGSTGYPNLNDDDWLWGGSLEAIHTTLTHGIRHAGDDDTRISDMPRFGADELLTNEQITDVAWFVRKLSGQEHDADAAARGEPIFAEQCAACHGEAGEGVADVGGPRLNDALWLYGGEHAQIVTQISRPRQGVMPAWGARLGETTVKQLAVYVHSLGGGQ